jgi:hypothetical protein
MDLTFIIGTCRVLGPANVIKIYDYNAYARSPYRARTIKEIIGLIISIKAGKVWQYGERLARKRKMVAKKRLTKQLQDFTNAKRFIIEIGTIYRRCEETGGKVQCRGKKYTQTQFENGIAKICRRISPRPILFVAPPNIVFEKTKKKSTMRTD